MQVPDDDSHIPDAPSASTVERVAGFAEAELVLCARCRRANPPVRTNCLYCGAELEGTEASDASRRFVLRELEEGEQGFNVVLLPPIEARTIGGVPATTAGSLPPLVFAEVARLLRIEAQTFARMIEACVPLPLARIASEDEARSVERQLKALSLPIAVVGDAEFGFAAAPPRRIRKLVFKNDTLLLWNTPDAEPSSLDVGEVGALVIGHLFTTKTEISRRMDRKTLKAHSTSHTNETLGGAASFGGDRTSNSADVEKFETSADGAVLDIYKHDESTGWRIEARGFDFSCLGASKKLIATENFKLLVEALRLAATQSLFDDSYTRVRRLLEHVWQLTERTESRGWRRASLGRLTTTSATLVGNEEQFTRYARLRAHLARRRGDEV